MAFYSTTKILNNVFSGDTLNVYDYGSTAEVFNAVYDETNDALKVNLSGFTGGSGTSGTSGVSGTSGTSGVDGAAGTSGDDGSVGASGTSGVDGVDGTISGITSDTGFTYTTPVLSTPKLLITTDPGASSVFQMYNTSGVLYNVTIVGSTLTATSA